MRIKLLLSLLAVLLTIGLTIPSTYAKVKSLSLSPQAKQSIHDLSVNILTNGNNPNLMAITPQLDPQDYQIVKNIKLLPDNPLYFFKSIGRSIRLFFIVSPASKGYQLLQDGNEKTLESLLLIEKANNEKDSAKHQKLINLSAKNLDQVGADFDQISQTIDKLKIEKSFQAYFLQEEAFRFSAYWLKHQILLQKQADQLSEPNFLTIESARIKHLASIAHIVVSENKNPLIFSSQLAQLISPQVGSNYANLAAIALLRDLENNASPAEQISLKKAQILLQKELEIKLSKLSKSDRLKLIEKYLEFIHGNPIREFQAYSQISKAFTSKEMTILTLALKDKAAQNFKAHLNRLDNQNLQKQFVNTLFSRYPLDLRLLFYTEIQLNHPKVLAVVSSQEKNQQKETQLTRLEQVKTILGAQICQNYGQNPEQLAQTRFYTQNINQPDVLDLKVAQFLSQSIQNCNSKSPKSLKLVNDLQTKINANFVAAAKRSVVTKLPTKAQAIQILKEEQVQVKPGEEQKVAEEIIEETKKIEDSVSEDTTILEKEIATVKDTIAKQEDTIASEEPTTDEIIQKEEEIIEQIEDAAATGETSPLVEELPAEIQEEIKQETKTSLPTPTPTPLPVATLSPTIAPISSPTPAPTVEPTPTPTIEPSPTAEPTLIETVTETVSEPAPEPTPEPVTAPSV